MGPLLHGGLLRGTNRNYLAQYMDYHSQQTFVKSFVSASLIFL